MAVHTLLCHRRVARAPTAEEPGADTVLAVDDSIGQVSDSVHAIFGQPVVDKTGLDGRWDFTMRWTPDETQFADVPEPVRRPTDDANAPPPLFTAIQKQLGLKLEAQKADVKVLVVDHVDHPSPN